MSSPPHTIVYGSVAVADPQSHNRDRMTRDGAAANSLLQLVDEGTWRRLNASRVDVIPGQVLQQSAEPETYAFFPITAVVSIVSKASPACLICWAAATARPKTSCKSAARACAFRPRQSAMPAMSIPICAPRWIAIQPRV